MKIFFGKIAQNYNPRQFQEGYYDTDSESWFNGIDVGDYAFVISGSDIELWQAKNWTRNRSIRLDFEKKVIGIEGQTARLIAFKYFKLFPALLSATTKSLKNIAFVPIPLAKPISESELLDPATYQNSNNFRSIVLYETRNGCVPDSEDLQLYLEGDNLQMYPAAFIHGDTFKRFRDNRDKIGLGQRKKDKTLEIISNVTSFPKVFTFDTLNLRNVYEAFAVPYKEMADQDDESLSINQTSENFKTSEMPILNQILYGPPGTGKTYHTINKAIEIIEPDFDFSQGRPKVKEKFDELCQAGRIVFTTFHQSMSYEDFVEGIKPQEPTAEQMQVTYKVEPGIFKLICEKARQIKELKTQNASIFKSVRFYKMSLGGFNRSDIYEWCLENNCLALGWGNDVNFESYKGISDWATYRDKFITENPALVKESRFNITAMYGFQNMRAGDIVAISKGNRIIDAIGRVEGEYYWGDNSPFGYFQFRKIEWLAKNINQDPEYFFNKKITQQSIYQFYDVDVKKESFVQFFTENSDESTPKPHVLIIDEINRGNVSQIFGELITLLETDKRMGNEEALKLTLPYSKALFSVPSNLYIIGTMNTADRSVEALDSALRRRFSFVEMPPKTDLPQLQEEISGIKLSELLETINRRIEKLLDKDHLIGHSYFLNISNLGDLQNTFYRNIIPLLQEYFFGDFGKIGLILGSGFVELVDNKKSGVFADFREYEDFPELDERRIYRIKKEIDLTEDGFKSALGLLLNKQI